MAKFPLSIVFNSWICVAQERVVVRILMQIFHTRVRRSQGVIITRVVKWTCIVCHEGGLFIYIENVFNRFWSLHRVELKEKYQLWACSLETSYSLYKVNSCTDLILVEPILKIFRSYFKVLEYGIRYQTTLKPPQRLTHLSD